MTADLRRWLNILISAGQHDILTESALRRLAVGGIDIDAAAHHLGLPIDSQSSRRALRAAFAETKRQLLALFGDDPLTIYRIIVIEPAELDVSELGISWAWEIEGAIKGSHIGDANGVLITGQVSNGNVDWATTVAVNTFHEDEREIVLVKGAPVRIVKAETIARQVVLGPITVPTAGVS